MAGRGALSPFAAYSAAVMADSPAGFWPLNETSGTVAADISGNAKNGSYNGSYTLGSAVGVLPAVDFSGGYVNVPDDNAFSAGAGMSGQFTVDAWVRFDTVAAVAMIVAKAGGAQHEFDLRLGDSVSTAIAAVIYTPAGAALMNTTQTAGQVAATTNYHLAMTFNYSTKLLTVYRNGSQLVQDTTSNDVSVAMVNGTNAMQFGHRADGGGVAIDGKIGCVAYYPTELSAARVLAHYNAGL